VCGPDLGAYQDYRVLQVKIKNLIGFLSPWAADYPVLSRQLELRAGETFSMSKLSQDNVLINRTFAASTSVQKLKVVVTTPQLLDCDPDARTLRVVYRVFTNLLATSIAPTIEQETNESERPATTGAVRASPPGYFVRPIAGYNQTLGTFGGLDFFATSGKFRLRSESQFSGNSKAGHVEVAGSNGSSLRYAGTFEYLDTPAGAARAQEAKLTARFSGLTKELSGQHVLLRYGGALEGGHQQANAVVSTVSISPNSSYGALKLYAGVTGRPGNSAFTASYGFQLGSDLTNGVPTFKKHLVDVGYNARLFAAPIGDGTGQFAGPLSTAVHRSLDLETRFTAGVIQSAAGAPLAERFLGGNQVRPFVSDESWIIQSDAFIRSVPDNQLGNGSRFYCANATLAWTVWGRPMLPKELATDTDFLKYLNGGFATAVGTLADTYKAKSPEYAKKSAAVPARGADVRDALNRLGTQLKEIPPAVAVLPAVAQQLKEIQNGLRTTSSTLRVLVDRKSSAVGPTLLSFNLPSLETQTGVLIKSLQGVSQGALASQMQSSLNDVEKAAAEIKDILAQLASPVYETQAKATLAPAHRIIDIFLHDLNIYSIAPVAIFDAARVWGASTALDSGAQYGVGGGVRFSLVNVNLTAVYAYDPNWVKPRKPGAVVFKFDVTNLFH